MSHAASFVQGQWVSLSAEMGRIFSGIAGTTEWFGNLTS